MDLSFEEFFERFRKRIREVMEEFEREIGAIESMWRPDGRIEPLVTIEEYPDKYIIIVDLPMADLRALTVKVVNHRLTIECELKRELRFDHWFTYKDVSFKKYHTTLTLPPDSDPSRLSVVRDESRGLIRIIIPRITRRS